MRQVTFAVILLCSIGLSNVEALECKNGKCGMTFVSHDPKRAHNLSANRFQQEVGDKLKASYPSKIVNPRIELRTFWSGGRKQYSLTWICELVKTTPQDADFRFDRIGTLRFGATLSGAEEWSKKDNRLKLATVSRPPWKVQPRFVQESHTGSNTEGYWYIEEIFLVAPK